MKTIITLAVIAAIATTGLGQDAPAKAMDERLAEIDPILRELEPMGRQNLNVPRSHGEFLRSLVEMSGAKRVLEVGTSNGYSSLWIGLGLEKTGGELVTLDIDPEKVKQARANIERAGMSGRITVVQGDALETIPAQTGKFDFVFLDAVKSDYPKYFELSRPMLTKRSLVVAHNAISAAEALGPYFELMNSDPNMQTTIVAIQPRDGIAVTYIRRKP